MDLEGIKAIIDRYRGFGKPLWITEFGMTVGIRLESMIKLITRPLAVKYQKTNRQSTISWVK